jgi:exosortase F-associated protein
MLKIAIIGFLFLLLGIVRVFEDDLFYDPFILFYKQLHYIKETPNYSLIKILTYTFFRYSINCLISIAILFIAFRKKEVIRFSVIFYITLFIILISIYTITVINLTEESHQIFFYIRRFLIQPIFILILLPAFYYQQNIIHRQ